MIYHEFKIDNTIYSLTHIVNSSKLSTWFAIYKITNGQTITSGFIEENNVLDIKYKLLDDKNLIEIYKYIEKYFKLIVFK